MMDEREDRFADRIAEPLRELERADPTFEARAMSAVHAAARSEAAPNDSTRSWWTRRRTVQISPLGSLALAAGLAGLAVAGSSLADGFARRGQTTASVPAVAVHDTVHVVRFVLVDSIARRVALVGEFNQWDKNATLLHATGTNGVWTIDVPLSAGRHEYAFIVIDAQGERWVADPIGQLVHDEFGTQSTVISVGAPATS